MHFALIYSRSFSWFLHSWSFVIILARARGPWLIRYAHMIMITALSILRHFATISEKYGEISIFSGHGKSNGKVTCMCTMNPSTSERFKFATLHVQGQHRYRIRAGMPDHEQAGTYPVIYPYDATKEHTSPLSRHHPMVMHPCFYALIICMSGYSAGCP